MSTSKNIDYLSELPPELLEDIFDQVQHSPPRLLGPLSQSLLPFQQKPLFRILHLDSYRDLEILCDYVKIRPQVAEYTRTLNLHIPSSPVGGRFDSEAKDPHSPSDQRIKELFASLVEITRLVIIGTDRVARLVLDPDVAATCFPNLRDLILFASFSSLNDPFHPASYLTLQYYNELRTFDLNVERSSESIEPTSKDRLQPVPIRTRVDEITLRGPLSATPTPEIIRCLALEHKAGNGPLSQGSFIEKLKNFPNLSELELGGTVSTVSPSLYTSLRSLPLLRRLTFSESANVSLEELGKVISGPGKLKSLKSIVFDNVEGWIGTRIREKGPYWNQFLQEWGPHPDWIVPQWSEEFSEQGLIEFMKDAEEEGITIEGTAIEAFGVFEEWTEEEEEAKEYQDDED
ncbi:uncharacterized protein JCM6883_001521 [Sporobolomyces salmoneus]|uniref:uncharacterized protein n=1 Tax=Sporobolomyces salmoneus TaxID=183962 RepID=UPI00317F3921